MFHLNGSWARLSRQKWMIALLLISIVFTSGFAPLSTLPPDAHTFVKASSAEPDTLDPALSYETVSGEMIQNIYETLVFFDGAHTDTLVPQLASSYDVSVDGLTYTFQIHSDVNFHNGNSLTASDVAYSIQRGLLQGGVYSPQWLFTEAFFGVGIDDISLLVDPSGGLRNQRALLSAWDATELEAACTTVKAAVVADNTAGTVTMTLHQSWAPFLITLAGTWGSIMDQQWVVANGGWDGSCSTWQNFYAMNSASDPFSRIANGTGPFKLDHWTAGTEVVLSRNDSYRQTPAQLEQVKFLYTPDAATRLSMLKTGLADQVDLNSDQRAQADAQVGDNCVWNIASSLFDCSLDDSTKMLRRYKGRPGVSQDEVLMNFNIVASGNTYIGTGTLDGNGIPVDFFADVHIRKAFNYCFDWDTYKQDVYGDGYSQAYTLALESMPGYDLSAEHYDFDLTKCAEQFGLADVDKDSIASKDDTNDVTEVGFHVDMLYNTGNASRQKIAEILKANLQKVDSKFVVDVVSLDWTPYNAAQGAGKLPIMTGGWLEDIHDPHNWYQPYLVGSYGKRLRMPDSLKTEFNDLINQGVSATSFSARDAIYKQVNQKVYDNAPIIMLGGATGYNFIHRRVLGQVLNAAFPGNFYYPIYKDTRTISGSLGSKGAGATLTYTGGTALADSAGAFSFSVPLDWSGSITPTKSGYINLPTSKSYTNLSANSPNQNYDTYPLITLPVRSNGTEDGWILELSETSSKGGTLNAAATTLRVGDSVSDKQYRSILSFNTKLPTGAVITGATLKLMKQSLVGTSPISTHQGMKFEIRKLFFGTTQGLVISDFQAPPSTVTLGSFSSVPSGSWYSGILSNTLLGYINKTGNTQFRIRFYKDDNDDNGNDYFAFYTGNAVTAQRPKLDITYYVP